MYSEQIRTKALAALNSGKTLEQVSKRHGVSIAALGLWKKKSKSKRPTSKADKAQLEILRTHQLKRLCKEMGKLLDTFK